MAYPAGMSLCVLTTGSVTDFFGSDASITATVTPVLKGTSHIVHETTGALMVPSPQIFTAEAGEGISFAVPHTDQDGWRDGAGNAYKGWYYKVALQIGQGRTSGPAWTKTVAPILGQALVDLDLVAGEQIGVPVSAPVATVSSIAGLTGAVTEEQLQALGLGGATDPEIAGYVQDPETLTGAALVQTFALKSEAGASDEDIAAFVTNPSTATGAALESSFPNAALPPAPQVRRAWPAMTMVADMQAGHGFTNTGPGTFILNDTADYAIGTQSLSITTDGAKGNAEILKTGLAVNLGGKGVVVWLKVAAPSEAALGGITLDLRTNTTYDFFRANVLLGGAGLKNVFKVNEWFPVFLNRGHFSVSTNPSWENITAIRLVVSDNGGGVPVKVNIGGIAAYTEATRYPNGVVSLTFDDSYAPTYLPKMSRMGYAGTIYPIVGNLDKPGMMTTAQIRAMHNLNGFEVGAHAMTDATHADYATKDAAWVETQMRAMRAWQRDNGFSSSSFAYPIGTYTAANAQQVAKHYVTQRGTTGSTGVRPIIPQGYPKLSRIPSTVISVVATTLDQAKDLVTRTVTGKGWAVLCFHAIVPTGAAGNDWSTADFEALMDHIAASGIAVAPVGDVASNR